MDPANFFTLTYPNEQLYNMSRTIDIVCWTFPIVLAVCVWDWIINAHREYERIWKREFSIVTVFYAGSRYWTMICLAFLTWMYTASNHPFEYCEKWFRWSCGMTIPIELFSGGILLLRTYAFTGRKLSYLIIFVILYLTMFAYMMYVTFVALMLIPWFVIGQTRGRCITAGYTGNHIATGFWVAPLGFSLVLTSVTLVHSVLIRQRMPSSKRSPLFKVFLRDGLLYLAVVTLTNVLNVAFFTQKTPELEGAAMSFQFLLSSLMSCHLVLSLRDAEMKNVSSAAASIATRSFWKSGHTGAGVGGTSSITAGGQMRSKDTDATYVDGSKVDVNAMESREEIAMNEQRRSPGNGAGMGPVHVHIDRSEVSQHSEDLEKAPWSPHVRY